MGYAIDFQRRRSIDFTRLAQPDIKRFLTFCI